MVFLRICYETVNWAMPANSSSGEKGGSPERSEVYADWPMGDNRLHSIRTRGGSVHIRQTSKEEGRCAVE